MARMGRDRIADQMIQAGIEAQLRSEGAIGKIGEGLQNLAPLFMQASKQWGEEARAGKELKQRQREARQRANEAERRYILQMKELEAQAPYRAALQRESETRASETEARGRREQEQFDLEKAIREQLTQMPAEQVPSDLAKQYMNPAERARIEAQAKMQSKMLEDYRKAAMKAFEELASPKAPKNGSPTGDIAELEGIMAGQKGAAGAALSPQQRLRGIRQIIEAQSMEDLDIDRILETARGTTQQPAAGGLPQNIGGFNVDWSKVLGQGGAAEQAGPPLDQMRRMAGALEAIPAQGGEPQLPVFPGLDEAVRQQLGIGGQPAPTGGAPSGQAIQDLLMRLLMNR